jgi:hypothetical protein
VPRLNLAARKRLVIGAVGALALSACQKPLKDAECKRLLDRYTEFLVREEDPGATPERVAHALEEARIAAERDPRFEMARCGERVPRRGFECAMNAPTVDAIERCLVF